MLYSLLRLKRLILNEHPELSEAELDDRATRLRRELHRLDKAWERSQQRFMEWSELVGADIFEINPE